jgi:uncharacterized protein
MQQADVTRLFHALGEADGEAVHALIAADRSLLSAHDSEGRSVVLYAVYAGQPRLAWELIRLGAPEEIFEASALGDLHRVSELVRREPSGVAAFSADGWTPLHLASFFGHPEVVAFLLRHGAPLASRSRNPEANLPLHAAVAGGHAAVVEVLLNAGADPATSRGPRGTTPLHLAAASGDLALLELLLEKGGAVGVEDDLGRTPVEVARRTGHPRAAEFLVRYGARVLLSSPPSGRSA